MSDSASADTITCTRCSRDVPPLGRPPMPGPRGQELARRVCADCWEEWQHHEVMVINELRLNFMDPKAQGILDRHMAEFLRLEGEDSEGAMESFFEQKAATEEAVAENGSDAQADGQTHAKTNAQADDGEGSS